MERTNQSEQIYQIRPANQRTVTCLDPTNQSKVSIDKASQSENTSLASPNQLEQSYWIRPANQITGTKRGPTNQSKVSRQGQPIRTHLLVLSQTDSSCRKQLTNQKVGRRQGQPIRTLILGNATPISAKGLNVINFSRPRNIFLLIIFLYQ